MCGNPRNIIIDSDRAISAEQLDIVFNNNTTDKVLEKLSEDKELGVEINRVRRLEIEVHGVQTGAPNDNFRKIICSEDDLRSRIFGSFSEKFLACLPLLGFSNFKKIV